MSHAGKIIFLLGVATLFLIGLDLRLDALGVATFNEWIARDFDRAFNIIDGVYIPLAGPELNNGGRLPGPFLYFFLTIPVLIKYSYHSFFIFNFVLNILSIIGLFIVLKKYFDLYVAGITSGLVSINFLSVVAVYAPINPSFIFPFVTIFTWLLLEFALKGNSKVIPFIVLTLSLAIQIHYSIATYFLILIILGLIFRLKVPLKIILASLVVIVVCLLPYAIHKNMFFTPTNAGHKNTLVNQDFSSPWVNFKVLSLLHTFNYLNEMGTSILGTPDFPRVVRVGMNLLTAAAFYVLFFIVLIKYKNKDWRSCKKETAVLIIFWAPAFLYGIVNPMQGHLWYGFIFVVPQALLLSVVITTIYRRILYKHHKIAYLIVIAILFFIVTISTKRHTTAVLGGINKSLFGTGITKGSFKNTQLMLSVLSRELNLQADEFYERVYLADYQVLSKRRLKMLNQESIENSKSEKNNSSCYFIFDATRRRHEAYAGRMIDIFLNDKSINIISNKSHSLSNWGFSEIFNVYQYKPIQSQSCYSNTFNPFVTTESIRNLLAASKGIEFLDKDVGSKIQNKQIKYLASNDLDRLTTGHAINNKISQSPFQFNLNIIKIDNGYSIKGEIELYSYYSAPHFDLKRMDIIIKTNEKQRASAQPSKTKTPYPKIKTHRINILSPKTPANYLNHNSTAHFNYNQRWYREMPALINLQKGKFNIYLTWTLNCGEFPDNPPCPLKPERDFTVPLYKQFPEENFDSDIQP